LTKRSLTIRRFFDEPTTVWECTVTSGENIMGITLTIMPDFGGAYCWAIRGDAETHGGVGGCCGLPMVRKGMRMHVHPLQAEFEEWQDEFERAWNGGEKLKLDWRLFHAEGIGLARRLKASLGDSVRVIYEKPYEDELHEMWERREVMLDGDLVDLPNRRQANAAAKVAREQLAA
jgi:hypothetical protein